MNDTKRRREIRFLATVASAQCVLCFALFLSPICTAQTGTISLASQAKQWLMQDAPPNPPLRAWLDGLSTMMKEKNPNVDATVRVTSTVLPSGLVEVTAKVGPNVFLWQVNYSKRKYYCMNKFTQDFMDLIAKTKPLR